MQLNQTLNHGFTLMRTDKTRNFRSEIRPLNSDSDKRVPALIFDRLISVNRWLAAELLPLSRLYSEADTNGHEFARILPRHEGASCFV